MTMRHLFLSLPTMNDTNGYEAKCLPVRGTRLNASHAVGLVREPYRTQEISPRAAPSRFGAAPSSVTPSLGLVHVGGPAFEAPRTHPTAQRPLPRPTRRVRSTYSLRGSDCPHTLRPREHPDAAPRRASTVRTTRVATQRCEAQCRGSGPRQSRDPPPRFSRRFHRREPKWLLMLFYNSHYIKYSAVFCIVQQPDRCCCHVLHMHICMHIVMVGTNHGKSNPCDARSVRGQV